MINCLGEPAGQQLFKTRKGNQAAPSETGLERQMKSVNGVQEEQRPNALIQIRAATAKDVELGAERIELRDRSVVANGIERPVANVRIGRSDDLNQRVGHKERV